jgi:carbon-monoxide dehydrogenase medium subunit
MYDFDVLPARSLDEALDLLAEHSDLTVVAGGTDFIPAVRAGVLVPEQILDISGLDALRGIREVDGGLSIGALVTHARLTVSPLIRRSAAPLAPASGYVAGPQVRNRATLGGNLCNASPAADTAPALLVLNAQVKLMSARGERQIPLADFIVGPGQTSLEPGELLHSVFVPETGPGVGTAFRKLGRRRALACSVVNAAAVVAGDGETVSEARLALGAVAPVPIRCRSAEAWLKGATWGESLLAGVDERVLEVVAPIDDVRASAEYRRAIVPAMAREVLKRAWRSCGQ